MQKSQIRGQSASVTPSFVPESQTQDETQYPFDIPVAYGPGRRFRLEDSMTDVERPRKKQKVSVTTAVDLAE